MKHAAIPIIMCVAAVAAAPAWAQEITMNIVVSPSVININAQGNYVTVHTSIPYVEGAAATLHNVDYEPGTSIAAFSIYPDDCGDLVAKFHLNDVVSTLLADAAENPIQVLGLTVTVSDDEDWYGIDTVKVVDVIGKQVSQ